MKPCAVSLPKWCFHDHIFWSTSDKTNQKQSPEHFMWTQNHILVLAKYLIFVSLSLSVYLSLLSFWIMCHWDVKKNREHGSPLLHSSRLHVCDVIITHIKDCALNTATVSFPGGVIKKRTQQTEPGLTEMHMYWGVGVHAEMFMHKFREIYNQVHYRKCLEYIIIYGLIL